ncbi:glycosyl transferase group 1 [Desulfitobacterium hafniense DCB-2]|uniref:Glycosyl transferase group 1 n=1 Tax=Desulfitobacterium hafniense (strain DSM 10664 / DCB-2) TaxID=272564 RepID=B8FTU2_DESHD|nr:glycosyltransferase family 4 protein [Desulfitobacterium hafniense]ACL22184.1 glycosyl transferase group 1 [Desulfitobacterium hafniense DCB-2]
MNIVHIASHMGNGAGKAIGGMAILGKMSGENTHRIVLLDTPQKLNHIVRCRNAGVEVVEYDKIQMVIADADVVVLNWWGGKLMDSFLEEFPDVPCRVVLWSHKNGYFDPPLPDLLINECDYLLATSPLTLENPNWCRNASLVYGCGDFQPELVLPKNDYALIQDRFTIGYVGSPSYKKLPPDYLDYCNSVIRQIPNCHFILAGETTTELQSDILRCGMERYFTLAGWVSNVDALLRTFDVFGYLLHPHTFATTENAVLEAMAAAVPTVISRDPLGMYLLEDRVSGFLVGSPEEYGSIMRELYESETLRKLMGQAGRIRTIQTYRPSENFERFNIACSLVAQMEKRVHSFRRKE